MAFHLLRILMFVASGLIVTFGLPIFVLGTEITTSLSLEFVKNLTHKPSFLITDMGTPNVDSELRSLAPFFFSYGVFMFLCAKHLRTHLYYVPHLLGVFLLGGLGRALSYFVVGKPHPNVCIPYRHRDRRTGGAVFIVRPYRFHTPVNQNTYLLSSWA